MDKLDPRADGSSLDTVANNLDTMRQLFPEAFVEARIDFDTLRDLLGDYVEDRPERYSFTWHGKSAARRIAQTRSTGTLRPRFDDSVDWETTENLFIEGDNLEVLKLLQKSYYGRVKMIYIDPPYNTGGEFIYPDRYQDNLDTYLRYTGQVSDEGFRISANSETGGRYHTNWLNMIYPRLRLARNLLSDDGLLFVSIDDNECANLRKVCDEIFGEECFVAQIIWEKRITRENRRYISVRHDYVLAYVKTASLKAEVVGLLPMDEAATERYANPDNDPRGVWTSVPAIAQGGHGTKSQFYSLTTPAGRLVDPPSGSCWRYTQERMREEIAKGNIWFGKDGTGVPRIKKFITDGKQGLTPETIWWAKDVGTNDSAKRALVSLFDGVAVFDTPKPVPLIERMLELAQSKDAVVLDFFAGSCPTAEAVLSANSKDGGSRRFIAVQLPEPCAEDTEAFKAGYLTIADVAKERIRRAGARIAADHADQQLDVGFRVFSLDSSNILEWDPATEDIERSLLDSVESVKSDRLPADVLVELLLKSGLDLSTSVETVTTGGATLYVVGGGALVICLDAGIPAEVSDRIAETKRLLEPEAMRVVFRDACFTDDVAKTNAIEMLRLAGIDDVKSV